MQKLPLARTTGLVMQEMNDEVLIYDCQTNKTLCLNRTSAVVFRHCTGDATLDDLKSKTGLTDEIVFLAIDELQKENLIEKGENIGSPLAGLSRREAIKKVGLASIVALPVITSLIAPQASRAASSTGAACQPCTANSDCASGVCAQNLSGAGNICTAAPNTDFAYGAGGQVISLPQDCGASGAEFCCAGNGAAFNSSNVCVCNA